MESIRRVLIHIGARAAIRQRLIATYVLKCPESILSSSIAEIRDGSGASVGSIVGFCRSLRLKEFAEFKIALARELWQSVCSRQAVRKQPG